MAKYILVVVGYTIIEDGYNAIEYIFVVYTVVTTDYTMVEVVFFLLFDAPLPS